MIMDYPDNQGQPYHLDYRISQQVDSHAKIIAGALSTMPNLHGWCSEKKAEYLLNLILNNSLETVVEIGVFGGKSFIPMAYALKELQRGEAIGVDPWDASESVIGFEDANREWWANVNHEEIYQHFMSSIKKYNLTEFVTILRTTSEEADIVKPIDLIHIDGNHSEESALSDVIKWVPKVKKGGYIILDDLDWVSTGKAVEWLDNHCERVDTFQENNIWACWKKK